ncbi:hypothetical protein H4219_000758 [Mycoemilia scoparia]|uniref:Uncharacterized protein n=1 Tax=Mycoemilia scoparia TaxID=417184 RepID=A0A9W8A2M0_9FUNG|nr:hypothetical protein H4219_000758 [Mycoemilia scoparia]
MDTHAICGQPLRHLASEQAFRPIAIPAPHIAKYHPYEKEHIAQPFHSHYTRKPSPPRCGYHADNQGARGNYQEWSYFNHTSEYQHRLSPSPKFDTKLESLRVDSWPHLSPHAQSSSHHSRDSHATGNNGLKYHNALYDRPKEHIRLPSFNEAFKDIISEKRSPLHINNKSQSPSPLSPQNAKYRTSHEPMASRQPRTYHYNSTYDGLYSDDGYINVDEAIEVDIPEIQEIRNFCTNPQAGEYDYHRLYAYYQSLELEMKGKIKKDYLSNGSNTKRYHRIQLICKRLEYLKSVSNGSLDRAIYMFKQEKTGLSLTAYTRKLVAINKDVKRKSQKKILYLYKS